MMSSGDAQERFKIGAHVDATDGRCGHLTRLIFDPIADALTHLIVEPGHDQERSRLVPVDLVVTAGDDLIRLNCTKERFDQLDEAEDVQFLPGDATGTGYGSGSSVWPYFGLLPALGDRRAPIFNDRVPVGEIEIRRGDPVHAKDGPIGAVQGLVVDPADHHVTHVLLQKGHVWGHKQVAIPIGVSGRADYEVRVDLTKDEIEALPPVSLKSH